MIRYYHALFYPILALDGAFLWNPVGAWACPAQIRIAWPKGRGKPTPLRLRVVNQGGASPRPYG